MLGQEITGPAFTVTVTLQSWKSSPGLVTLTVTVKVPLVLPGSIVTVAAFVAPTIAAVAPPLFCMLQAYVGNGLVERFEYVGVITKSAAPVQTGEMGAIEQSGDKRTFAPCN